MKYRIEKYIEKSLILFWGLLPNKWLFWAVNEAWARATTSYYTGKQPDEITWSMMQELLSRSKNQAPTPRDVRERVYGKFAFPTKIAEPFRPEIDPPNPATHFVSGE